MHHGASLRETRSDCESGLTTFVLTCNGTLPTTHTATPTACWFGGWAGRAYLVFICTDHRPTAQVATRTAPLFVRRAKIISLELVGIDPSQTVYGCQRENLCLTVGKGVPISRPSELCSPPMPHGASMTGPIFDRWELRTFLSPTCTDTRPTPHIKTHTRLWLGSRKGCVAFVRIGTDL